MTDQKKKTILLVEDEAVVALDESARIEKSGYNVITADSGEEAVRIACGDTEVDLILMDINLGSGIDGAEAASRILALKELPVVFLSSHSEKETVDKVRGVARYGYVLKSSGDSVLQSVIGMALELFENRRPAEERKMKSEKIHHAPQADQLDYRSLLDSMINGFAYCKIIFDEDGTPADYIFLAVNSSFKSMTGICDIEGRAVSNVFPGIRESNPELFSIYSRILSSGQPEKVEAFFKPLGRWVSILANCTEKGFFTMVFEDISERRRLEEALSSNAEKYRQLFEAESDSLFLIDGESGRICEANSAAVNTYGYSHQELLSRRNTDMSAEPEVTRKAMDDRENFIPVRWHRKKDGTVFPVEISVSHLMLNNRPAMIAAIRDITERKFADDRIKSLLAEKEFLLKEVHLCVKDNMNTIYRLLTLQSHVLTDPSAVTAVNDTKNRVQSMRVLYEKLCRSDDYRNLSIKEYLTSMVDGMASSYPDFYRVKIEYRLDDFTVGIKIMFPLGLIVNELVANALMYAFTGVENGIITVCASSADSRAVIIVQDNGRGLPESINFWSRSANLGLNIVGMLTEQIGGSIRIERVDGTKFILDFNI